MSQFLFLCRLIVYKYKDWPESISSLTDEQIIKRLILPENTKNYYIRHENPQSRYIYAAIFLLVVRNHKQLNREWDLPAKFDVIEHKHIPFEIWWLKKF